MEFVVLMVEQAVTLIVSIVGYSHLEYSRDRLFRMEAIG